MTLRQRADIRLDRTSEETTRFRYSPELNQPDQLNPRVAFPANGVSHDHVAEANIIWYNNVLHDGTRDETRITRLGGQSCPLLDEENTGAITLFFFTRVAGSHECHYWVCRNEQEEDAAEAFAGPVEPEHLRLWNVLGGLVTEVPRDRDGPRCWLEAGDMPPEWLMTFPSPQEVFEKALELQLCRQLSADNRLVRRRACEYAVFQSIEYVTESEVIRQGFNSIESFIARAQTILQRRKSRSGRSLELQLKTIFSEENIPYNSQPTTESGKKPDFLFPSQQAYNSSDYPSRRLRMLGAKTTVKERWRQVVQEADRIPRKHLLTLQEGVSINQFDQMKESGIQLVVPRSLHLRYPKEVRPQLITLQEFCQEIRDL